MRHKSAGAALVGTKQAGRGRALLLRTFSNAAVLDGVVRFGSNDSGFSVMATEMLTLVMPALRLTSMN